MTMTVMMQSTKNLFPQSIWIRISLLHETQEKKLIASFVFGKEWIKKKHHLSFDSYSLQDEINRIHHMASPSHRICATSLSQLSILWYVWAAKFAWSIYSTYIQCVLPKEWVFHGIAAFSGIFTLEFGPAIRCKLHLAQLLKLVLCGSIGRSHFNYLQTHEKIN